MYVGPDNQSGEPSIGLDWNPNVASLQQIAPGNASHGPTALDTGGVAFYTANFSQYRVTFDDCSSPAINAWADTTFPTEGVTTLDPIGFTDHFSSASLGTSYPPPKTPGRTFQAQLTAGDSRIAYTDDDGTSHTPSQGGGVPQGPDHETLGGGPYNPNSTPPPPPNAVYANAVYYCTQNIAPEAECSRSDDGGVTFGPGVPIYQNPQACTGSIHGHVKVATDGTVYVPNFSCSLPGAEQGVAVSADNGLTWTERNVPGSGLDGSASVDPSVGIAQNAVSRAAGQTTPTIYFGYMDTDNTPKIAVSHDQGRTWSTPQAVGAALGVKNSTFPAVVAGDDNRAAFGFLGTTTSGDANSNNSTCSNFQGVWHLYIATTYDGGNSWTTIDATPNSPIQVGPICRGGTLCPGYRNLLDFNGFDVDSQGRGYFVISDGCIGCTNSGPGAPCGSSNALSVMFRQSGGPRLFSNFDSMPQAGGLWAPASPHAVAAAQVTGGIQVSWLEPDNGGSPITSYKIYRGTTSGGETLLATVSNSPTNTQTKYLDATGTPTSFYHVTAVNAQGESGFCQELTVSGNISTGGTACAAPYIQVAGAGTVTAPDQTGEFTIQSVNVGEPFTSCSDKSITFTMKVQTMDPGGTGTATPPPNTAYIIYAHITDDSGNPETVWVSMDTIAAGASSAMPEFSWGRQDKSTAGTNFTDTTVCTAGGVGGLGTCSTITGSVAANGLITIKLTADTPLSFPVPTGASGSAFTWTPKKGDVLGSMNGQVLVEAGAGTPVGFGGGLLFTEGTDSPVNGGNYTMQGNLSCTAAPPTAALSANPLTGNAPLGVMFDGSASAVAPILAGCDAIASYTLNFGDGSPAVTQTTSMFSHTYGTPGSYPATLTVTDTAGQNSTNLARQVITVNSAVPPQLNSVVSRMVHGNAGTFDVPLPLTGTRGVECRTSPVGAGNYTLVFTFQHNLMSVQNATVTLGAGTVNTSSSGLGPNANQYTVNLTGVTNAQYVNVTLQNALDSTGAIGNVTGTMGVLVGDTNGDGFVNSADISQTKSQSGQVVSVSNFREDVNADGFLNSADIGLVKSKSGTALPSTP
jgi:PKD repeat protein